MVTTTSPIMLLWRSTTIPMDKSNNMDKNIIKRAIERTI